MKHLLKNIIFVGFFAFGAWYTVGYSQWKSIGNVDAVEERADGILLTANPAKVQVTVLSPDVIRVRMVKDGTFLPDSSWAIVQRTLGNTQYTLKNTEHGLVLSTSTLSVKISKSPCRFS